ncbi:hypothetical protein WDV94_14170 [Clavibacter tessellarius]
MGVVPARAKTHIARRGSETMTLSCSANPGIWPRAWNAQTTAGMGFTERPSGSSTSVRTAERTPSAPTTRSNDSRCVAPVATVRRVTCAASASWSTATGSRPKRTSMRPPMRVHSAASMSLRSTASGAPGWSARPGPGRRDPSASSWSVTRSGRSRDPMSSRTPRRSAATTPSANMPTM